VVDRETVPEGVPRKESLPWIEIVGIAETVCEVEEV